MQKVIKEITIKEEDENNVTIDLRVSFNERFDTDLKSDFNDNINSDEDINDENI